MVFPPSLLFRWNSGRARGWSGVARFGICLLVFLAPGLSGSVRAQQARALPQQALSLTLNLIDFQYAGASDPATRFDYRGPAWGLTYSRPNLLISGAYGPPSSAALDTVRTRLIDLSLSTWGVLPLVPRGSDGAFARARLYVPIGLLSNYRRVQLPASTDTLGGDEFSVTTLGLTAGLGAEARLSKGTQVEVRLAPGLGLGTRSFGDASGLTTMLDADAQMTFGPIAGRYAISLGYGFRYLDWHLRVRRFLASAVPGGRRDYYHYRTLQHGFRLGIAF